MFFQKFSLAGMVQSLVDFQNLNQTQIFSIFHQSLKLKKSKKDLLQTFCGTAGLLFFEPSTRTRFSFQTACIRQGVSPLVLDGASGTSLEKGESIEDTIFNLEAMGPLFFVVRCSDSVNLREISSQLKTPVINAGWGKQGHPTQALLDTVTLFEKWNTLEKKKILFVGDVRHSRVFASHQELSQIMGYQLGCCAPPEFSLSPEKQKNVMPFDQLEQALEWADAVVTLRVQKERHGSGLDLAENYRQKYGLSLDRARRYLKPEGLILHPGPINYGVEIEKNVLTDSRSVILQLVENGVFIREAVLQKVISGELS